MQKTDNTVIEYLRGVVYLFPFNVCTHVYEVSVLLFLVQIFDYLIRKFKRLTDFQHARNLHFDENFPTNINQKCVCLCLCYGLERLINIFKPIIYRFILNSKLCKG